MKHTTPPLSTILIIVFLAGAVLSCRHSSGGSTPEPQPPSITISASAETVEQGGSVTLSASAQPGENDGGTISYQWFETDGETETKISSATGTTFSPDTSVVGTRRYFCRAESSTAPENLSAKSNTISITVTKKSSGGDTAEPPAQETPGSGSIDFDFDPDATGGTK